MKPKKFSINFIHRPEFFYAAFELELKIEGKNICEFTVDGKIEKDTANLIFLSDWFENNLKFILSEEDKFPYKIKGNCGIEIIEKAYEMGNKNHEEIEWFEKIHEWSERHLWTFSGLEMVYPDVMFRKINDKIEVSWDSTNKYRDNMTYKIEFTNLKGKSFIKIEEFKKEILKFIEKIKESVTFWEDPYIVIDNEDETTDIFVSRDEEMFWLMDEKGFYIDELSG